MSAHATYVYAVIAYRRRPPVPRALRGVPYSAAVRLLPVNTALALVVSNVPLSRFDEAPLSNGLGDLDWVSRVAVGHNRVVEAFLAADAVLPVKVFTIFADDDRALRHFRMQGVALDAVVSRVSRRDEWGVRVTLSGASRTKGHPTNVSRRGTIGTGSGYLRQKQAHRDEARRRSARARAAAAEVFSSLGAHATEARKRPLREIAASGGPLVLDAALLVPRSASARLRASAARHARVLAEEGLDVALTGPWPPYSFMQD